jgi:hypothetical protein
MEVTHFDASSWYNCSIYWHIGPWKEISSVFFSSTHNMEAIAMYQERRKQEKHYLNWEL